MVTEDYVSYETAKLLKEKGFDEGCSFVVSTISKGVMPVSWPTTNSEIEDEKASLIALPTLQMAMKWLREEHNKIIIPGIRATDPITGIIDCYYVGIHYIPKNNGGALCFTSPTPENGYSSYEEACEAGIKYCLENLI